MNPPPITAHSLNHSLHPSPTQFLRTPSSSPTDYVTNTHATAQRHKTSDKTNSKIQKRSHPCIPISWWPPAASGARRARHCAALPPAACGGG